MGFGLAARWLRNLELAWPEGNKDRIRRPIYRAHDAVWRNFDLRTDPSAPSAKVTVEDLDLMRTWDEGEEALSPDSLFRTTIDDDGWVGKPERPVEVIKLRLEG